MLSSAAADVAGVMVEVVLFGGYTVLFAICIWVIWHKRTINLLLSSAAIANYVLAALYVALDLQRLSSSIKPAGGTSGTSFIYTLDRLNTYEYVASYSFVTNSLIADSILIWRCFAVWGRNPWVITLPVITLIGTGIGGYGSVYFLSRVPDESVAGQIAHLWGLAGVAMAIGTNVTTTLLTAGQIWWQRKTIRSAFGNRARHMQYYSFVLAIVIESGSLYCAVLISELFLYQLRGNGTLIVVNVLSQITGIVPTMIIVYAALGNTIESSTWTTSPRSVDLTDNDNESFFVPPSQKNTLAILETPSPILLQPPTSSTQHQDGNWVHVSPISPITAKQGSLRVDIEAEPVHQSTPESKPCRMDDCSGDHDTLQTMGDWVVPRSRS